METNTLARKDKIECDNIFVVLVYKNTEDLKDFFKSLNLINTRVIVVNSYFDDTTEKQFQEIAEQNNAFFLSVPNKGYGYGNNRGCEYALKNFRFKHLIISNADIEIRRFCSPELLKMNDVIIAPNIVTKTGKHQNPFMTYNHPCLDKLRYYFYKQDKPFWATTFISAMTRIQREFFKLRHFSSKHPKIYAAHGAFVVIPSKVLARLYPLYNEEMFLFAEEEHLAQLAISQNVCIIFDKQSEIYHKEDGSTSSLGSIYPYVRKSWITYYEYWNKK